MALCPPSTSYLPTSQLPVRRHARRRGRLVPRPRANGDGIDSEGAGLFDFVTNNPSSKSAIQLDVLPGQESEVGRISYRTSFRGRDFGDLWDITSTGSSDRLDMLSWFIRELNDDSKDETQPPIIFLHGVPSQSYSFLPVLVELANRGFHCYAPDWPGFGYSQKPQPKYGFNYTEQEFHKAFDNLLRDKDVKQPFQLVAHGFITGQYAVTWALRNPDKVERLVIMDMPLSPEVGLPARLATLKLPFMVGQFASQDCLIAERTLEGGSPYVMSIDDAEIYRYPYLTSSTAGFALLETVRAANLRDLGARLRAGLAAAAGWATPTLILTGDADKYIDVAQGQAVADSNKGVVAARSIEAAGHQPQEDYPQLVVQALAAFLS